MASKKSDDKGAALRGAKLIKKAIEAGRAEAFADPEPVAAAVIKKMTLPNGEPVSPAMKELLKVDALWLGIEFDEDEGDIEASSLEELVEDHFGEDAVAAFGEATELFAGDCIPLGGASDSLRFLYVGEPDETGEYPVITAKNDPKPWIGGFVPFDVWVAQELGALPAATEPGQVPEAYASVQKELADANGDGRLGFEPTAGEGSDDEDDEDDEDEDDDEDADGEDDDAAEGDDATDEDEPA
jgi:hypothetical protein